MLSIGEVGHSVSPDQTGVFMTKISFAARSTRARFGLLASAATLSLVIGGTAQAQTAAGPVANNGGAYTVDATTNNVPVAGNGGSYSLAPLNIAAPVNDPNIVIAPPGTSVTDRDPTNVTDVGQMIIDQKNGFIGLCTGTLITPRTVIFAAHCDNESPTGTAMLPWG